MIDALDGMIKYNPVYLFINIGLATLFAISWYRQYKQTGINLDIWIYNMFLIFIVPFIFMYPFATSDFNIIYVGSAGLNSIESGINEAYIVTLIGFISMFVGKLYFDKFGINYIVNLIFYYPFISTIGLYYVRIVENKKICQRLSIIYVVILGVFVSFTVLQGFVNNPRAFFMTNAQFRPFYNLILSLFSIVFGIMATRILQFNSISDKLLLLPILIMGFFLGVRAPLIFQILGFGVLYVIYKNKGYIALYKMMLFILAILVLVIILAFVRNNDSVTVRDSLNSRLTFLYEILYGNTFSDLRDFSWVLGNWDGTYIWGMTYLSALFAFIPSAFFPFRETWGIGKITVNMVGFDPTIHPGLRPGFFGEMYLNFGIVGVILLGFVWAQVLQKANDTVKKGIISNDVIGGSSALTATTFVFQISNSSGFFGFYVLFIVLFIFYLFSKVKLHL